MMRPPPELTEVYLCVEPVDFRKGIDGLAAIVEMAFGLSPMSPALFVFGNRRRDLVRILYWERNGFCLWQKRLEAERFHWLRSSGTHAARLTGQQLNWLLDGYDIARMKPHKTLKYSSIS